MNSSNHTENSAVLLDGNRRLKWLRFGVLIAAVLLSSQPAKGQFSQPDETLPGFHPQDVLEGHGIDNVSPFSGDTGIVVPLGPEYTLSPFATWQLKAVYSAKLWRMDAGQCQPDDPSVRHAYVRGDPTIGIGWTLNLGYMGSSGEVDFGYFSPDGGFHADGTDGSHIRITPVGTPITSYTVEFPDGSKHTFGQKFNAPQPVSGTSPDFTQIGWPNGRETGRFGLTQIQDSFGTVVLTVQYFSDSPPEHAWEVHTVTLPTLGQTVTFHWTTSPSSTVTWRVVDHIDLPVFGATTLSATFTYTAADFVRNIYDNSVHGTACLNDSPTDVWAPFLSKMTLSPLTDAYTMDYYTTPTVVQGRTVETQFALQTIHLPAGGYVTYTYDWATSTVCQIPCDPESLPEEQQPTAGGRTQEWLNFEDKTIAVVSRCESTGATPCPATATTSYSRKLFTLPCFPLCDGYDWDPFRVLRRVDVVAPGNDSGVPAQYLTRYFFHAAIEPGYRDGGIELERRSYAGASTSTATVRDVINCWTPVNPFVTGGGCGYHTSAGTTTLQKYNFQNLPPPQIAVTWYGTLPSGSDGGTCATGSTPCKAAAHPSPLAPDNDYDTVAQQYKTTTFTNASMPSPSPTHISFTEWAAVVDSSHWLLDVFDEKNETEASTTIYRGFEFDQTGFARGQWTSDQPYGTNSQLWIQCRYPDTVGQNSDDFAATLTGLSQPSPPPRPYNKLCSAAYSSFPSVVGVNGDAFGHQYTWTHGDLLTAKWINGYSGGVPTTLPWSQFNVARDGASGLVQTSYDTAGVSTGYGYDVLARLTSIAPSGGEAATTITYDSTTQTTVSRSGTSGTTWARFIYDGLGRLVREIKKVPQSGSNIYAARTHAYDSAGHQTMASVWTTCSSAGGDCLTAAPGGTTSSSFDPFGRAQLIVGPSNATYTAIDRTDGTVHFSDTLEKVTGCINGTWSGTACSGTLATTSTHKDTYGRIVSVTEPTAEITSYIYDVNGKLTTVTQGGQSRRFTYDSFGFLRQEVTPEKGTVDSTGYGLYDSLGHVRTATEAFGTPSPKQHNYSYDAAGRLAIETVGSTSVLYLMNCYDGSAVNALCPDNVTSNFSGGGANAKGKLTRRFGTNPRYVTLYPMSPEVSEFVREDLTYSGLGGRLSDKTTAIVSATGNSPLLVGGPSLANEHWNYNDLGLDSVHKHPRVPGLGLLQETLGYTYGSLTSISTTGTDLDGSTMPAATITATYKPAGNLATYAAQVPPGPILTTTISQDDTVGLPRPSRIQSSAGGFDTLTYAYDAAGNIMTIGSDAFKYDSRSRLISAVYSGQLTPCPMDSGGNPNRSQCFGYDRFGNLTGVSGVGGRPLTTSTTSNQLTSGTYDNRGNLLSFSGESLIWDDLNRQTNDNAGTWQYLYTGADERLVKVPAAAYGLLVSRREMARYIVQGKPFVLTTTTCSEGSLRFSDVHCADPDWQYIQTFSENGITAGCGNGTTYCPEAQVTRAEMAVFLLKAEHGSGYPPPSCHSTHVFADVLCPSQYADWIGELSVEGITAGCNLQQNLFCPNDNVPEWQMTVFMSKGPLWPAYKPIPGGSTYTLRGAGNLIATEFADSFAARDNVFLGTVLVASYLDRQPTVNPGWQFHSSDHLGTVRLTVDSATLGSGFIERPKYWPYGDLVGTTIAPLQRLGFAAMERDVENNHFYDHARHHDFNAGRFVSVDKVAGFPEDPQSWNRYVYALTNPIKYKDPTGLAADLCPSGHVCATVIVLPPATPSPKPSRGTFAFLAGDFRNLLRQTTFDNQLPPMLHNTADDLVDNGWLDPFFGNMIHSLANELPTNYASMQTVNLLLNFVPSAKAAPELEALSAKIVRDMERRGWTVDMIVEAFGAGAVEARIDKTVSPFAAATRYVHPGTGQSVIINDATGAVIQVGGPGFKF